jgi:hypothetical protein
LLPEQIALASMNAASCDFDTYLMPTFWNFWDSTLQDPVERRFSVFFEIVVAAYPDLFHHGLIASGALTDLASVPAAVPYSRHWPMTLGVERVNSPALWSEM